MNKYAGSRPISKVEITNEKGTHWYMVYPLSSPLPPWREAVGRPEGRQGGAWRCPENFYALVPEPLFVSKS